MMAKTSEHSKLMVLSSTFEIVLNRGGEWSVGSQEAFEANIELRTLAFARDVDMSSPM